MISRGRDVGVRAFINIGIDPATSRQALELAASLPDFHAAVGLHPTSVVDDLDGTLNEIRELASDSPHVVAIGEIGLDYHWKDVSAREQRPRFKAQLSMAHELELPVVIHCREAIDDLFIVFREWQDETRQQLPRGVLHCFEGGEAEARRALDLGFDISFAGNVTYKKKSEHLQSAARFVPLDRLLLETDAPFLAPHPRRGKRNEPAFLVHSREFLAGLKGVPAEVLDAATEAATRCVFKL